MNDDLVKIKLHGVLGKRLNRSVWNLDVSSVNEAMHAINCLSEDKLYHNINKLTLKGVKYIVKVNNEIQKLNKDKLNPLNFQRGNIKTIDVVPVIEGAFMDVLGMALGASMLFFGNDATQLIGATLLFTGLSNALSKPPERPEDRLITNPSSDPQALSQSYLFGGPVNVINEGGPVPIGYGRLIIGSQVILTSYDVSNENVETAGRVI